MSTLAPSAGPAAYPDEQWTIWGQPAPRRRRRGPLVAALVIIAFAAVAMGGLVLFVLSGVAGAAGGCGGG